MTGEEDDRQRGVRVRQLPLEVETAESRQPHVEDQAARHVPPGRAEERLGGREHLDGHAHRRQQTAQRLAHGPVVVDDEDDGRVGAHGRSAGSAK